MYLCMGLVGLPAAVLLQEWEAVCMWRAMLWLCRRIGAWLGDRLLWTAVQLVCRMGQY
jgi:hypothetical protein